MHYPSKPSKAETFVSVLIGIALCVVGVVTLGVAIGAVWGIAVNTMSLIVL